MLAGCKRETYKAGNLVFQTPHKESVPRYAMATKGVTIWVAQFGGEKNILYNKCR